MHPQAVVGNPTQGLQGNPVKAQLPPEEVTQCLRPILPGAREAQAVEVGEEIPGGRGEERIGGDPRPCVLYLLVGDDPKTIEEFGFDPGAPADAVGEVGVLATLGVGDLEEDAGARRHGRGEGRRVYQDSYRLQYWVSYIVESLGGATPPQCRKWVITHLECDPGSPASTAESPWTGTLSPLVESEVVPPVDRTARRFLSGRPRREARGP